MLISAFFKLAVIFRLVAVCTGGKCWWQLGNDCQNGVCNNPHHMGRRSDKVYHSDNYFCPKSKGRDIVLCTQPDSTKECYTSHVFNGQNCTNVDAKINNLASSVHTFGRCIRLYDKANCEGEWKVFNEDTFDPQKLMEMNKRVTSAGLCVTEDWSVGCNQATGEGSLRCLFPVNKTNTSAEELKNSLNAKKSAHEFTVNQKSRFDLTNSSAGFKEMEKGLNISNQWGNGGSSPTDKTTTQEVLNSSITMSRIKIRNHVGSFVPRGSGTSEDESSFGVVLLIFAVLACCCLCDCCKKDEPEREPESNRGNTGPGVFGNTSDPPPYSAAPGVFVVDERGTAYRSAS